MASLNRSVSSDNVAIKVPVQAGITVEIGDFIFKNAAGAAIPASGVTWVGPDAKDTVAVNKLSFLGVALDAHIASAPSGSILVGTDGMYRFPSSGVQTGQTVGGTWTIAMNTAQNGLLNQLVVPATSSSGGCIAHLAQALNGNSITNNGLVKLHIQGVTAQPVPNNS